MRPHRSWPVIVQFSCNFCRGWIAPLQVPWEIARALEVVESLQPHTDPTCQVDRFWNEVRLLGESREIKAEPDQGWAGIGLLYQR